MKKFIEKIITNIAEDKTKVYFLIFIAVLFIGVVISIPQEIREGLSMTIIIAFQFGMFIFAFLAYTATLDNAEKEREFREKLLSFGKEQAKIRAKEREEDRKERAEERKERQEYYEKVQKRHEEFMERWRQDRQEMNEKWLELERQYRRTRRYR